MQVQSASTQEKILEIIEALIEEGESASTEPVTPDTQLIAEAGLSSMDFIQLVVAIEDEFDQKFGFHELLVNNGEYVEELRVSELISFVERKLHSSEPSAVTSQKTKFKPTGIARETLTVIEPAKIEQFQQGNRARASQLQADRVSDTARKNPPALFILSPPRSGSTLLRVMLAGHPDLFAPPELHLLSYKNLTQRKEVLAENGNDQLLEGTIKAVAQLKKCTPEVAETTLQQLEARGITTQEFYRLLQEWAGERMLVDKTPTYASYLEILKRAEMEFENPLYIHLLRHPYGMIHSYVEAKLDQVIPIISEGGFSRQELAELTWLTSHETIMQFLPTIPACRQLQVKFEDLVTDPKMTVNNICSFLNIDFNAEMLELYKERNQRMTDGVGNVSQMSGDLKFHLHQGIDTNTAYRWQEYHTANFLCEASSNLAALLGYDLG